eukprot:4182474-Amphidinium_carterae.1
MRARRAHHDLSATCDVELGAFRLALSLVLRKYHLCKVWRRLRPYGPDIVMMMMMMVMVMMMMMIHDDDT